MVIRQANTHPMPAGGGGAVAEPLADALPKASDLFMGLPGPQAARHG